MFRNILFPVDFSERSKASAPFVLSMAHRYGSRVVLLHAIQPPPPIYAGMNTVYPETFDFTDAQEELSKKLTQFAASELPKADTSCVVEIGDSASVIVEFAERDRTDLIVMPTHGYGGFRRALLGSVTAKVLHDAKIPVWTSAHAPEPSHRAHPQPRAVLVAVDLKTESRAVLDLALAIAREAGATVDMVHAAPEGEITPDNPDSRMQAVLSEAVRDQSIQIERETGNAQVEMIVDTGSVAHLVREMALRKRSDLIVIGRGATHSMFGGFHSHAYAIVREAPCPVISV